MPQPKTHGTPWTLEFGFISYFPLRDPSFPLTLPLLMKGVARNSPQHSEEPQRHWYLGNKQPESCPSWLLSTWYKLNHLRGENIKWENASVGAVCRQAYEAHFLEWWSTWSGTLRVVLPVGRSCCVYKKRNWGKTRGSKAASSTPPWLQLLPVPIPTCAMTDCDMDV